MDVPEVLTRKIGPLPAGAWVLAIGGGIAVAVMVRRGAQDSEAVANAYEAGEQSAADSIVADSGWDQPDPGGTEPGTGGSGYFDWYDGTSDVLEDDPAVWLPEVVAAPAAPAAADAGREPAAQAPSMNAIQKARDARSNGGWRSNVKAALVARGYRGGLVDTAFSRWWAGKDLTGPQSVVVAEAVAIAGAPPNPPKAKADTSGPLPTRGGGGGGNGGGNGGDNGGGKHKWEPKSAVNRKCRKCGKWRDTSVHTNRG